MFDFRKSVAALAVLASVGGALGAAALPAAAQSTLKAVMNSDLKILDPIWTTAYVQRGLGYLVWDTLFSVDDKFAVKPQMVDTMLTLARDEHALALQMIHDDGTEEAGGRPEGGRGEGGRGEGGHGPRRGRRDEKEG